MSLSYDSEIEIGMPEYSAETNPDWQEHLSPARIGNVTEVNHRFPAKPIFQDLRDDCFRFGIVATDEDIVLSRHP